MMKILVYRIQENQEKRREEKVMLLYTVPSSFHARCLQNLTPAMPAEGRRVYRWSVSR